MGMTRAKKLRLVDELQALGHLAHDTSQILYTFADGWTIRRMISCGDVRRESVLMANCIARFANDTLDGERVHKLIEYVPSSLPHHAPLPFRPDGRLEPSPPRASDPAHLPLERCPCSLRDEMNLPRATFFWDGRVGSYPEYIFGPHNHQPSSRIKQRMHMWAEALGLDLSMRELDFHGKDPNHVPQVLEIDWDRVFTPDAEHMHQTEVILSDEELAIYEDSFYNLETPGYDHGPAEAIIERLSAPTNARTLA